MLQLSKKTLLALEAVLDVAIHARPDPVQARQITKRQGVPQRYLEHIMQALARADILRSIRGPRGGYRLARERRRITIGHIMHAIAAADHDETSIAVTSILGQKTLKPLCDDIQNMIHDQIGNITIDDLLRDYNEDIHPNPETDFTI